jgi:beta-lactamase class D
MGAGHEPAGGPGGSNLAIFQPLARHVGLPRLEAEAELARLNYRSAGTGGSVGRFWLDGGLVIRAVEQARFLADLARGALPYSAGTQDTPRLESNPTWALHGKTRSPTYPEPGIGWWLDWVNKGERGYAFAQNMDMKDAADAGRLVALGRACLTALGGV